jgi:hypothetical protein
MLALMAQTGIKWQDVADEAHAKAHKRGRFQTGAWLTVTE